MAPKIATSIAALLLINIVAADNPCVSRDFGYGSVVCVCNSTYCDSASVLFPPKGQYRSYTSSPSGKRLSQEIGRFNNGTDDDNDVKEILMTLKLDETFQNISGFGGAFTDSTGINLKKLSTAAQDQIMEAYYGANGSRYAFGRVPIGGSDFSTRPYTYDDNPNDVTLEKFALADEDYKYKIPYMLKAQELHPSVKFFAAAWSAPGWMKTNNALEGLGYLKEEYYQTYADYIVKFLLEYRKQGVKMWAVSTGNEPADVYVPWIRFNTMGWTPTSVANWVGNNLGPSISRSASNATKILLLDDQRFNLPWYPTEVFQNVLAEKYIAGIAVHWYWDTLTEPTLLDNTHDLFPDKFLMLTEACTGSSALAFPKVRLGDWNRGEQYILDIMENLSHWVTGWVDWNLVLDKQGGPNWVKNYVDSPIIVNPETDEFFKQPMYYAMAHFSKFINPDSVRIGLKGLGKVEAVAFMRPDKAIVIVLYNRNSEDKRITLMDPEQGNISIIIEALSIKTIIYKR